MMTEEAMPKKEKVNEQEREKCRNFMKIFEKTMAKKKTTKKT